MMKILRALLNVGSMIILMLMVMLKEDIIVISLENIEAQHVEIVVSMRNQITKFLLYFTIKKKMIYILLHKFNFKKNVISKWIRKITSYVLLIASKFFIR